jgi:hypothetical protein
VDFFFLVVMVTPQFSIAMFGVIEREQGLAISQVAFVTEHIGPISLLRSAVSWVQGNQPSWAFRSWRLSPARL